jgi:hypothetical protein
MDTPAHEHTNNSPCFTNCESKATSHQLLLEVKDIGNKNIDYYNEDFN